MPVSQACIAQLVRYNASLSLVASGFWKEMISVAAGFAGVAAVTLVWSRKAASVVVIAGGLWFYAMLSALDLAYCIKVQWATLTVNHFFAVSGNSLFGILGVLSLAVAVLGAMVYGLSVRGAVFRIGAPAVLCFELAILAMDSSEMTVQAANFLSPLKIGGVYLMNNWVMLAVSACLTAYGFLFYGRQKTVQES